MDLRERQGGVSMSLARGAVALPAPRAHTGFLFPSQHRPRCASSFFLFFSPHTVALPRLTFRARVQNAFFNLSLVPNPWSIATLLRVFPNEKEKIFLFLWKSPVSLKPLELPKRLVRNNDPRNWVLFFYLKVICNFNIFWLLVVLNLCEFCTYFFMS